MGSQNSFKLRRRAGRRSAFSLVEVLVAASILVIYVVIATMAMTQLNRFANSARLRTMALALAQQRIDDVLTVKWPLSSPKPALLNAGTQTETDLPLNGDTFNSQTGLSSAFTDLDVVVNTTRSTVITNLTTRQLRAEVSVTYTYRSRTQTVTLATIRSADSI